MFSGVLSGRDDLRARVQPQCGWLISDAPLEQRARTVPRSGVSSVRLMRHCPRSYAVEIIKEPIRNVAGSFGEKIYSRPQYLLYSSNVISTIWPLVSTVTCPFLTAMLVGGTFLP